MVIQCFKPCVTALFSSTISFSETLCMIIQPVLDGDHLVLPTRTRYSTKAETGPVQGLRQRQQGE